MTSLATNPELVRHLRTELRQRRVIIATVVSYVAMALVAMTISANQPVAHQLRPDFFKALFITLIVVQSVVFLLWCVYACGNRISTERMQKTFDFVRTTRLSAGELVFGMVFGLPSMAYFILLATSPAVIAAGLLAHYSIVAILLTYFMLFVVGLVLSLFGLLVSMLMEKPQPAGMIFILWLCIWPWSVAAAAGGGDSIFPALITLSVVPCLLPFYGYVPYEANPAVSSVTLFGLHMPSLLVSLLLFASFGLWLAQPLLRNLKKDMEDMRLLSRWQGIGLAAYFNVVGFAMLDMHRVLGLKSRANATVDVSNGFVLMNCLVFYAVGLAMVSSAPKLRAWWRNSGSSLDRYWNQDGPPLLWMLAAAATALAVYAGAAVAWTRLIPLRSWPVPVLPLFVVFAYAAKDIMFLQWCCTTRFRRPVTMGVLFLGLYYAAVTVVILTLFREPVQDRVIAFFMPFSAIAGENITTSALGAGVQLAVALLFMRWIELRLDRPARILPAGSSAAA